MPETRLREWALRMASVASSILPRMRPPHDTAEDERLASLLLALRLHMPRAGVGAEIEARMSVLLGVEVHEAFRAVAAEQQHAAPAVNLDRAHKSALVFIAHVLAAAMHRAGKDWLSGDDLYAGSSHASLKF